MRDSRLWAFQRLFALCLLVAWWSLGSQVLLLVGEHGLLAFAPLLERVGEDGLGFWQLPSVFRWGASDAQLLGGCWLGAACALLALLGVVPRAMFALSLVLYFSYAEVAGPFLSFQWDNLLLEAAFLLVLGGTEITRGTQSGLLGGLSRLSGGAWAVLLLRLLLFKLYFESGLAKLESPAGDWLDGSAMAAYYETAPLPGPFAWHAHALPVWFHRLENWSTLVLELLVPLFSFGPRRARRACLVVLSLFQCFNIATANYGFFSYLSLALHVVLFDHSELRALAAWSLRRGLGRKWLRGVRALRRTVQSHSSIGTALGRWRQHVRLSFARLRLAPRSSRAYSGFVAAVCGVYTLVSVQQGVQQFISPKLRLWGLAQLDERISRLRLINTYHLFAQITLERIEPTFSVLEHGQWTELSLHYKPGEVRRDLPLVAPHQPRVDFLLWFYGLRFRGAVPNYVKALLHHLCHEPQAVAELFVDTLPAAPERVRLSFWQYHFTNSSERASSGAVWRRSELEAARTSNCVAPK